MKKIAGQELNPLKKENVDQSEAFTVINGKIIALADVQDEKEINKDSQEIDEGQSDGSADAFGRTETVQE